MAMWGVTSHESVVPESSGPDKVGNLLNQADFIVVMEGRQRNFLTRFMDYSSWNKFTYSWIIVHLRRNIW